VEAVSDTPYPAAIESDEATTGTDRHWRRLFADLANGRIAALDDLYDASAAQLYGLALWRTGSEDDAADVVQDVFVKVAEQGPKLAGVRNPKMWLLTVTRRTAIDLLRRRGRRQTEDMEACELLVAVDQDLDRRADAAKVSATLRELPPAQRLVIYLRHFADCTFREIGSILGVPTFTASSRYRLGIARLRQRMGGNDAI
jgi:RNA polymerase sigma-70 factor (ECF subfamily)